MASLANTIADAAQRGVPLPRTLAAELRRQQMVRKTRAKLASKILHAGAQALQRTISVVTLAVPLAFFVYGLLASGVLRQDVITGSVRMFMETIVLPAKAVTARIFAVPMIFHGLDLVVLGWGLLALVLREVVLEPFRKLEKWSADKLQVTIAGPPRRRRTCQVPQPHHT